MMRQSNKALKVRRGLGPTATLVRCERNIPQNLGGLRCIVADAHQHGHTLDWQFSGTYARRNEAGILRETDAWSHGFTVAKRY